MNGLDPTSRLHKQISGWLDDKGVARAVTQLTVWSVVTSAVLCYLCFYLAPGPLPQHEFVVILGLVLPILVPAIVAPVATYGIVISFKEAARLVEELKETQAELEREAAEREVIQQRLEELVRSDPMTGALNRRGFYEAVERSGGEITVFALFDVDQFKPVNDGLGHAMGDAVLINVVNHLQQLDGAAIVSRLGGDEFVVGFTGADVDEATLRSTTNSITTRHDGKTVTLRVSMGTARPSADRSIDETLAEADHALYLDKAEARMALELATPPIDDTLPLIPCSAG